MTLWQLFVLISAGTSFVGAWTAAEHIANTPFVVAVFAAVAMACGCAGALEVLGREVLGRLIKAYDSDERRRALVDIAGRAMYVFGAAWCVASYFVGYWLMSRLVRSFGG